MDIAEVGRRVEVGVRPIALPARIENVRYVTFLAQELQEGGGREELPIAIAYREIGKGAIYRNTEAQKENYTGRRSRCDKIRACDTASHPNGSESDDGADSNPLDTSSLTEAMRMRKKCQRNDNRKSTIADKRRIGFPKRKYCMVRIQAGRQSACMDMDDDSSIGRRLQRWGRKDERARENVPEGR